MNEFAPQARPDGASASVRRGWLEALRSLCFLQPRWDRVQVTPLSLLLSFAASVLAQQATQFAVLEGSADFYWQAVAGGWASAVLLLWISWGVTRHGRPEAPSMNLGVPALFGTVVAQCVLLQSLQALLMLGVWMLQWLQWGLTQTTVFWLVWGLVMGWAVLAGAWLLGRHTGSWAVKMAV